MFKVRGSGKKGSEQSYVFVGAHRDATHKALRCDP
jgi:hypothetical protein